MATKPITITGIDSTTGNPILVDNNNKNAYNFRVDAGDTVQWNINPNSGVSAITRLPPKEGSTDVFQSGDPHKKAQSNNWEGTVKESTRGEEEDYNIIWTDEDGGTHTFDPKISVNN